MTQSEYITIQANKQLKEIHFGKICVLLGTRSPLNEIFCNAPKLNKKKTIVTRKVIFYISSLQ